VRNSADEDRRVQGDGRPATGSDAARRRGHRLGREWLVGGVREVVSVGEDRYGATTVEPRHPWSGHGLDMWQLPHGVTRDLSRVRAAPSNMLGVIVQRSHPN
jgi:hypothetical protein